MNSIASWLLVLLVMAFANSGAAEGGSSVSGTMAGERHFELLNVGAVRFTNVWVHRQTNYHILIRHAGGIHTIKLTDLPGSELAELRSQIGDLADMPRSDAEPGTVAFLDRIEELIRGTSPRSLGIVGVAAVLAIVLALVMRRRNAVSSPGG